MSTPLASPSQAAAATIFRWEAPDRRRRAIIVFLTASAVLHALCFYLFQISYPPTVALLPPPARINLITAATEEGRVLLRWLEAEDPALSFTTQRAPDAKSFALPKLAHVPSFMSVQPALREPRPLEPDLRVPSGQPPGPVPVFRTPEPPPTVKSETVVEFSPELQNVGLVQLPAAPRFTAAGSEAPQVAEFRIGVSRDGDVHYCFVHLSSGDTALDEQAHRYLVRCRFKRPPRTGGTDPRPIIWGTVSVRWGNDVAPPPKTVAP